MSNAKAKLNGNKIILPLHFSQGGIRIADKNGNHFPSPTKTICKDDYYVEWMITNKEIKLLSQLFNHDDSNELIGDIKKIEKFAEDSEYSKRSTSTNEKEIAEFEEFKIYQYTDIFNSFEKVLDSGLKVRLTFKLGDYGVVSHPHMYVLIPFDNNLLELKNKKGVINKEEQLGSGCFGELILNKEDLKGIILTLAHASKNHRNSLIQILS
ncbi:hypothetical protein HYW20_02355 [Candidatus Woesearchaeota archaeon]|nr:hypothetical protein [Candidatus Woesearchaeota archaeon]